MYEGNFVGWLRRLKAIGGSRITRRVCMGFLIKALVGLQDPMEDQKMDISPISDESCILDVAWEVVYCSKRYPPSG